MNDRRWFWPLVLAGILLLSVAGACAWSVIALHEAEPQLADVTWHVYWVEIDRSLYVVAAVLAALGVGLLLAAARLR